MILASIIQEEYDKMKQNKLLSQYPYILRAFYEWLLDNKLTPYLVIDVTINGVILPIYLATNTDKIIFNINPQAVVNLKIDNNGVSFTASFSGISSYIFAPTASLLAIYAHETGIGTIFKPEFSLLQQVIKDYAGGVREEETSELEISVTKRSDLNNNYTNSSREKLFVRKQSFIPNLRVVK